MSVSLKDLEIVFLKLAEQINKHGSLKKTKKITPAPKISNPL